MPTAPRTEITVVGSVAGPSGEPLPGIVLSFASSEPRIEDFGSAITGSDGAYSVRLISGTYRVQIDPPIEYGFMARTELVTVSDRHNRVDFAFLGHRVTGSVVDPNGNLLDNGGVSAQLKPPGQGYAASWLKQGSYSLLLPAGTYLFHAGAADYWSGFSPERRESVQIAADTTIDFHLGGILVSGKVLGPDGPPMEGVAVEARGENGYVQNRTAIDGGYRLYVPSGPYRLWFRPPHPFYIIPRIVGPLTITAPISIDGDLSGIEWSGTVRRLGTNEPAPGISIAARMVDDDDQRAAAIRTGLQGEFRFVLEADRRYDLTTYDPESGEQAVRLHGVAATADTTLEILIPLPTTP